MRVECIPEHLMGHDNLPPVRSRAVRDFRETLTTIQGSPQETPSTTAATAAARVNEVKTAPPPAPAAQPAQVQGAPQAAGAPAKRKGFLQAVFEGIAQVFKGIWAGLRGIFVGNGAGQEVHAQQPTNEPPGVRDI